MKVTLVSYDSLAAVEIAARTCYDSFKNSKIEQINQFKTNYMIPNHFDKDFLVRLINRAHFSPFEFCYYHFFIENLPRYVLQELVRHRIASYAVKSTRYTLSDLKTAIKNKDRNKIKEIVTSNVEIKDDSFINDVVDSLLKLSSSSPLSNDLIKPFIPECWLCDLNWKINFRSLVNFLNLRMSKKAHPKMKLLAEEVFRVLPDDHKEIMKEALKTE